MKRAIAIASTLLAILPEPTRAKSPDDERMDHGSHQGKPSSPTTNRQALADRVHSKVDDFILSEAAQNGERTGVTVFIHTRTNDEEGLEATSLSAEIRDGQVIVQLLNGKAAQAEDVENHIKSFANAIQRRVAATYAGRRTQWERIEKLTGIRGLSEQAGTASSVTIEASSQEIKLLSALEELVSGIQPPFDPIGADGLNTALQSVGLTDHAFPIGLDGTDVGMWINDGNGRPITFSPAIDNSRLTIHDIGNEPLENHATLTLATLQAAAPDAHAHFSVPTQACNLRSDVHTYDNPSVYVSSNSNSFSDNSNLYTDCSRDWDNFVYDTRIAHFALTQNQASNVRGAAKAYNVISVGAYDHHTSPDSMASFSNFGDPATGAHKPEVVAPGKDLVIAGQTMSGTSFSTPIAAGFGADLIENNQAYRYHPELIKSILMANARDIDSAPEVVSDLDGAGAIDFTNLASNGRWRTWNGGNGTHFLADSDGDQKNDISFSELFVAGRTYRVAISWLTPGGYVRANGSPSMDLDLQVRKPGQSSASWGSYSTDNTNEVIEFTADTTGWYQITIDRWSNSGVGEVALAYAVTPL